MTVVKTVKQTTEESLKQVKATQQCMLQIAKAAGSLQKSFKVMEDDIKTQNGLISQIKDSLGTNTNLVTQALKVI